MGEPTLGLHEPAISEIRFVAQNEIVTADPVLVVGLSRKIPIVVELRQGQLPGIASVESTRMNIERDEVIVVRPVAEITVRLPEFVITIVPLAIGSLVIGIGAKLEGT